MKYFFLTVLFLGFIGINENTTLAQVQPQFKDFEDQTVELLNNHRKSLGLNILVTTELLAEQARKHSTDMANGRVDFSHKNFEKRTAIIREQMGGLSFSENVSYGQNTAQGVFNGLLKNQGNRDNVEGDFTHVGTGVARSKDGTFYITQIFVKIDPNAILILNDEVESRLQVEIVELVNQHRATLGLNALIISDIIADQSRIHSKGMAAGRVRFSHDGFDKRADAIREQIGGLGFAENVAYGQTTAESVVEGWLNSPGHRKNIEGDFTHIGIGIAQAKDRSLYYTQIFAKLNITETP